MKQAVKDRAITNSTRTVVGLMVAFVFLIATTTVSQAQSKGTWLTGTWEGTGYQMDNNQTWTMSLRVRGSSFSIEYPSLNCSGVWRLLDMDSRGARFREKITVNVSECADGGTVTIERLNRRQIAFRYSYSDTRQISASAILNRKIVVPF
jgi:hypothetical protein